MSQTNEKVSENHLGCWVIDIRKQAVVTLLQILPSVNKDLFIVENEDTGEIYLTSEEFLIPYDKYYMFSEEEDE